MVLGQPNFGSSSADAFASFGEYKGNKTVDNHVFRPMGVLIDTKSGSGRMFVWDCGNNRILGFSDINKVIYTDYPANTQKRLGSDPNTPAAEADIVLGQPDFLHASANGDSNFQFNPPVDLTHYFDYMPLPSDSSLCGMEPHAASPGESGSAVGMDVDQQGNLYVPDYYNNRILRYEAGDLHSGAKGVKAAFVWGQKNDFTGWKSNHGSYSPDEQSLSFYLAGGTNQYVAAVAVDNWGNLWVADCFNNRVLRFPYDPSLIPARPKAEADLVLGQVNFYATVSASDDGDLSHLYLPSAIRVDGNGNVFVTDFPGYGTQNQLQPNYSGRLLVFKPMVPPSGTIPPSYSNGMSASAVETQYLGEPVGLELDPSDPAAIWVNDAKTTQIIQYRMDFTGSTPIFNLKKVLLRAAPWDRTTSVSPTSGGDKTPDASNFFHFLYPSGSQMSAYGAPADSESIGGLGVSGKGDVWVPFGVSANTGDVWRFENPPVYGALSSGIAHTADISVFKSSQIATVNLMDNVGFLNPQGLAVSADQLFVSDGSRLMFWHLDTSNTPSMGLFIGKLADGMTNGLSGGGGAGTPSSYLYNVSGPGFGRITTDQASPVSHLWALRDSVIEIYDLPLVQYETPSHTFSLMTNYPALGGGTLMLTRGIEGCSDGLAVNSSGTYLWVSDTCGSRVVGFRNPLVNPQVDIVLGQKNVTDIHCNQDTTIFAPSRLTGGNPRQDTLCAPGALSLDHAGNLYVSDYALETSGNYRLLEFDKGKIDQAISSGGGVVTCGMLASHIYDRNGDFTQGSLGCLTPSDPRMNYCQPFQTAFPANDSFMVAGVGLGSQHAVIFSNPHTNFGAPTNYLYDQGSLPGYSTAVDAQNNVYTLDSDRQRLLMYWNVNAQSTLPPTMTPTMTITPTPMAYCNLSGWNTVSAAQVVGGSEVMLTSTSMSGGAAWAPCKVDLTKDFNYEFWWNLGAPQNDSGCGMAFVMQNDSRGSAAIGGIGGGNGYGQPWSIAPVAPSVAVEIDTAGDPGTGDPTWNHLAVIENGVMQQGVSSAAGPVDPAPNGNIKDGNYHKVHLNWNAASHRLVVVVDDNVTLTYTKDVVTQIFGGVNQVYVGITAGSGGGTNPSAQSFREYTWCLCQPTFTPTITPSFTLTPTGTSSPSSTPISPLSCTTTSTMTVTATDTVTETPTSMGTWSPTATMTPSSTQTWTATSTETASSTSSWTPTATLTDTSTVTRTMTFTATPSLTPTVTPTATPECQGSLASRISLYPNPVVGRGWVRLRMNLCRPTEIMSFSIWTTSARKVMDQVFGPQPAGVSDRVIELRDRRGTPLANGLYYLVMKTSQGRVIFKLLVMR